jgi:hypothetical protein
MKRKFNTWKFLSPIVLSFAVSIYAESKDKECSEGSAEHISTSSVKSLCAGAEVITPPIFGITPMGVLGGKNSLTKDQGNQLFKILAPEIKGLRTPLEEYSHPDYHFVVTGDFNDDGVPDIAICGNVYDERQKWLSTYIVVATQVLSTGQWERRYIQELGGTSVPFIIWDKKARSLLIGADWSDADQGEVIWDSKIKEYRYVAPTPADDGM